MKFHAKHARWFAYLLHLLLPGLGHFLWRDMLFGVFIFLIMLIASALFFVAFFVPFGWLAKGVLFGMPLLFYVFSFFDLARTMKSRQDNRPPSARRRLLLLIVGLAYFFFVPFAPGPFLIHNSPIPHRINDDSVSPVYAAGDVVLVNRLSFSADLFFLSRPVVYALPERFDVVRVELSDGSCINAFMLGAPGEAVEIIDGVAWVNGVPEPPDPSSAVTLAGDWPLTPVGAGSILVVTVRNGTLDHVYDIPLENLVGRVTRVF